MNNTQFKIRWYRKLWWGVKAYTIPVFILSILIVYLKWRVFGSERCGLMKNLHDRVNFILIQEGD